VIFALFAIPTIPHTEDAKTLAQSILDKGSALFDTRDAMSMSATYTDDARLTIYGKSDSGDGYTTQIKDGRGAIEETYRDLFKGDQPKTTSKNEVLDAEFVAPDLLLIRGKFQMNTNDPDKWAFTQLRVKKGDKWLIWQLQLFLVR
jgi:hypothetical protein